MKKLKISTTLLVILRNFTPPKIIKFDYKYSNSMNHKIISSLRNKTKLTNRSDSNPTEEKKFSHC